VQKHVILDAELAGPQEPRVRWGCRCPNG